MKPTSGKRNIVAPYDRVFKADVLNLTNGADSSADGYRVTGAKHRDVLDRNGPYESVGANLAEAAMPTSSGKFAGQVVHFRLPARLLRPASKIQLLNFFMEPVGGRDSLQIDKDFRSRLLANSGSLGCECGCGFIGGEVGLNPTRMSPGAIRDSGALRLEK
jgi:hypothetical protein